MNAYAAVILVALLGQYALHLAADLCNLRALRQGLPAGFEDVYDAERYRRSQEYSRTKLRFGIVPDTFHLVVLLAFWGAGGFRWVDGWARGLDLGPIATGLAFIGALVLLRTLLSVPFSWYSTFVIEERFGFNKTTPRTFLLDLVKGLLLVVLLGGPLLAAILWFFEATGEAAWLWCWGATALFTITVQFVAPTWILPLFNRFEPLEDGELKSAVLRYAEKVSFPLEDLFVVDGSRRSTKANAFFTGFGKRKRVALFDTLVEKQSTDELVAVVAHEIGHYKRGHIKKMLALSLVQAGVVFYLLSFFLKEQGLFEAFGVATPSPWAGLVFFSLLFAPIDMVLSFFLSAMSRRNEFEADAYARETTGRPEDLVTALKRLASDSLQTLTPHPLYVKLHYTHPPLPQRIAALRAEAG